jgi:hypothetical protein
MSTVILVEIAVTSPAGVVSQLRFSDRTIPPFPPEDLDRGNADYDDRIVELPSLARRMFSDLSSLSPSLNAGLMTLSNADLALNAYQGHVWGEIAVLEWTPGTAWSTAETILKGVCAAPSYPADAVSAPQVKVALFDYSIELSNPLQTHLYAGSNDGVTVFYEGEADGLKGQPKPLAFGNLLNAMVAAPQVNAGALVYQLHDGAILGSEQLYDRGDDAGYTDAGDFSGAAFDAELPAAAHYCTDVSRGLLKLNGAPVGQLSFGFKGDVAPVTGYAETPGPLIARVLALAGVPSNRIGTSFAAFASTSVVGVLVNDQSPGQDVVGQLALSGQAAVLPDRGGVWQISSFQPPQVPVGAIAVDQVITCAPDDTAPIPAGEIRIGWGHIYTTYVGTSLAPALVGTPSAERLAVEDRFASATDDGVKSRLQGTWQTVELATALRNEADAQLLANNLKALFGLRPDGAPRRAWTVTMLRSEAPAADLGDAVQLVYPPLGLNDVYLVIGEERLRPRRDQVTLTLWG